MKLNGANITLILLVLASLSLFMFSTGLMSIIDDSNGDVNPSCNMDIGGGECNLLLKVPTDLKLSQYSFDIEVNSIPDENFSSPVVLQPFTSGGPYYEDVSTRYQSPQEFNIYLYRQPADWVDVWQTNITLSMPVSTYIRTTDGRVYFDLYGAYVPFDYPYNTVNVCQGGSYSDCFEDANKKEYLAKTYISTSGTREFSDRIGANAYSGLSLRDDDGRFSTTMVASGIAPKVDFENPIISVLTNYEYRYNKPSSVSFPVPPKVELSYKQEHFVNNFQVMVGDKIIKQYPGVSEGRIYLPDIADEINQYCYRDIGLGRECYVNIKFSSDDGGKVSIVSELGDLIPVKEAPIPEPTSDDPTPIVEQKPVNDFDFSSWGITGWVSLDFENNPVNTSLTLFVVLLVVGLITFGIWKGVKKK